MMVNENNREVTSKTNSVMKNKVEKILYNFGEN
jgi:hypothetical protein